MQTRALMQSAPSASGIFYWIPTLPLRARVGRGGWCISVWPRVCAVLLICWATASQAQTFTSLFSFDQTNGAYPSSSLVQGLDGNLYGTTELDGKGTGTVFRISPSGTLVSLYSFCTQANCPDGALPVSALALRTNGNFYGTTVQGGTNCTAPGCGTAFKVSSLGALTTLYNFCSQTNCTDGSAPWAGLVQATDGNFYGTTLNGGGHQSNCTSAACGTVFRITPGGALTTLFQFSSSVGSFPYATLVQGTDGNLYGTTSRGGAHSRGTIFKITTSGTLTSLYNFCASVNSKGFCLDGRDPQAGLIQGTDGNFYGTTFIGGTGSACGGGNSGCGTIFKITPNGAFTVLYSFCSQANCTDGVSPAAALIQGTDGNFYGTTVAGGTNSCSGTTCGTIFKITPDGTLTTLYNFCSQANCSDGYYPQGALVQATDGNFYGTTTYGGTTNSSGTVFKLSMGLGPFVKTVPNAGKVGATVKILGNNLTGTTSVSFNGTPATFTVVSKSQIKTTVPTGASTGTVTVTTPSGTLNSNVSFQVLP